MRTRWLLVLVMLVMMGACTTQGVDRARRWPAHRKEGDARFAELERQNAELAARVAKLEAWVTHAKVTKPPAELPPTDAPPPPP